MQGKSCCHAASRAKIFLEVPLFSVNYGNGSLAHDLPLEKVIFLGDMRDV
jgi:hypothetical protein